tara:strand:+ start:81 stop:893 length:813 start_codon:yes stop_codon:yes gene_type:complete
MAISITKPVVGGSQDTWGETLNTALDTIVDGVNGTSGTVAPDLSTLKIGGTDVTATANELNVMDGDTTATSTAVTGTDAIVYNDNGVMKQVTLNDINAFIQSQAGSAGNGQITITAGNALTGGGSFTTNQAGNTTVTVNHQDTSSQGSSNNSGNTFIQDITLDTYGHITGLGTATASFSSSGSEIIYTGNGSQVLYAGDTAVIKLLGGLSGNSVGTILYRNGNGNDRLINNNYNPSAYAVYTNNTGSTITGVGASVLSNPVPFFWFINRA